MWSVTGFEKEKKHFKRVIADGTLSHAYLISGPDMIGKKQFVLDLYALMNGRAPVAHDPDLLIVAPKTEEGESKIYIENIRDLKSFLSFKAYQGPYKCVIIDDADRLTVEASNALLKALEEPQDRVVFFLVSSQPKLLLPTIASRCQEVACAAHPVETIEEFLKANKVKGEDAAFAARMAAGRLGWAMRLVASGDLASVKTAVDDLQGIARKGIAERISYAKQLADQDNCREQVEYWLRWVHGRLDQSERAPQVASRLLKLHRLLGQPQFNARLAIENFLIQL